MLARGQGRAGGGGAYVEGMGGGGRRGASLTGTRRRRGRSFCANHLAAAPSHRLRPFSLPRFSSLPPPPPTRFQMDHVFNPTHGVFSYQLSNPCVLSLSAVYGSLQVFGETSMEALRRKSLALTRCGFPLCRSADRTAPPPTHPPPLISVAVVAEPRGLGCGTPLLLGSLRGCRYLELLLEQTLPDNVKLLTPRGWCGCGGVGRCRGGGTGRGGDDFCPVVGIGSSPFCRP
jgi:hypothetical protein